MLKFVYAEEEGCIATCRLYNIFALILVCRTYRFVTRKKGSFHCFLADNKGYQLNRAVQIVLQYLGNYNSQRAKVSMQEYLNDLLLHDNKKYLINFELHEVIVSTLRLAV